MSREPSPEQKRALKIWLKDRSKKPKQIAEEVGVSPELVRKWKSLGKWEEIPLKRPRGGQSGNRNAKNNKGGPGAPVGNDRAVKSGLFRKFLPDDEETLEIFDSTAELDPLEVLWTNIRIAFTNIMRAQKIQFVKDKEDMTKEIKKVKEIDSEGFQSTETEWNIQFAWDKQGASLTQQAAAMTNLTRMLKQYDEMLRALPVKEVKAEQRKRYELLKAQVDKTRAQIDKLNPKKDEKGKKLEDFL